MPRCIFCDGICRAFFFNDQDIEKCKKALDIRKSECLEYKDIILPVDASQSTTNRICYHKECFQKFVSPKSDRNPKKRKLGPSTSNAKETNKSDETERESECGVIGDKYHQDAVVGHETVDLSTPGNRMESVEEESVESIPKFSWERIENKLGIKIKRYIMNIFKASGLEDFEVLKKHDPTILKKLGEYVRSQEYWDQIPAEADIADYYGGNLELPAFFQFSPGDAALLTKIIDLIKTEPPSFWITETVSSAASIELTENLTFCKIRQLIDSYNFNGGTEDHQFFGSSLLTMFIRTVVENSKVKNKVSNQYERPLKMLAAFYYMLGGRLFYNHLSSNLPLPSERSVHRYIRKESQPISEGEFRVTELKEFLATRKLGNRIWLSEDATRITSRIQYDSRNNTVVGFVLPTNHNSMPIPHSFKATTAQVILEHFENNVASSSLNCLIAQPLKVDAPAFCLLLYGTDLKFTAEDCLKRWNFIINSLENEGVEVVGISTDGDARYLKTMRHMTRLGERPDNRELQLRGFHADYNPKTMCIQDTVHLVVKFKTRIFKTSILLPIGNYSVSATHLRFITTQYTKDHHLLNSSDFDGGDKMNFNAAKKICSGTVIKLLEKIPCSEGTREYLKIMNFTMLSLLSTQLSPLLRVYCLWYSVFFLRLWRKWLSTIASYSVTNNFVSLNTYICVEINAHALVSILLKQIEDPTLADCFFPWQFGSQGCEGFFRVWRSCDPVFNRVVNCSVLEGMRKSQRLQMIGDIMAFDFEKYGELINFPRKNSLNSSHEKINDLKLCVDLDDEAIFQCQLNVAAIQSVMERAKHDAFESVSRLGMTNLVEEQCLEMDVKPTTLDIDLDNQDVQDIDNPEEPQSRESEMQLVEPSASIEASIDTEEALDDDERAESLNLRHPLQLKDYSLQHPIIEEDDPFVEIFQIDGSRIVVRKSSLIYVYSQDYSKLSSDRLVRVRQSELELRSYVTIDRPHISGVERLDEIFLFDWCIFESTELDGCLLGFVLGFAYMEETSWRKLEYSRKSVKIPSNLGIENHEKKIGVHCDWFTLGSDQDGHTFLTYDKTFQPGYVELEQYRCSIPPAIFEACKIYIPCDIAKKLEDSFDILNARSKN